MTDKITAKTVRDLVFASLIIGLIWHIPAICVRASSFISGAGQ